MSDQNLKSPSYNSRAHLWTNSSQGTELSPGLTIRCKPQAVQPVHPTTCQHLSCTSRQVCCTVAKAKDTQLLLHPFFYGMSMQIIVMTQLTICQEWWCRSKNCEWVYSILVPKWRDDSNNIRQVCPGSIFHPCPQSSFQKSYLHHSKSKLNQSIQYFEGFH